MACSPTLSAFDRGCNSISGVEKLYLIDKAARESAGVTVSVAAGAATIAGTGATAYLINPIQSSFSFTQPITQDNTAGTSSIIQTIDGTLHGYSAELVALMGEIRKGRFEVALRMRNGTNIYCGLDSIGMQVGGGDSGQTGQSPNDPNGMVVNLVCECEDAAPTFTFSELEAAFTIVTA